MNRRKPFFSVRGTQECGWNIFRRQGSYDAPRDVTVNISYLDHLSRAGVNYLMVFWANAEGFDSAWREAVRHAHGVGLKLLRAVYGFSGGWPETAMAEPNPPRQLLRPSPQGPATALCPHEDEAREWLASVLKKRLEPGVDGIVIEPGRALGRNCICAKCRAIHPYAWDVLVINFMTDQIHGLKPDADIFLHLNTGEMRTDRPRLRDEYAQIREGVRHMFGWGVDDEASILDWLCLDSRFEHFAKLGRVLLFPKGEIPEAPVTERVARVFRWCRLSADHGKKGYTFDYRIFGGTEWQGHSKDMPTTRISSQMPASVGVMGAAMCNPYLDENGQREFLDRLRVESDWDLDDPAYFWKGTAERKDRSDNNKAAT